MLRWTLVSLVVAVVAGLFGFTGIAEGAAWIAEVMFFLFVAAFAASLVSNLIRRQWPPKRAAWRRAPPIPFRRAMP